MQDQNLPVSSQAHNTQFLEQNNNYNNFANHLQSKNYLTTLGVIASISSLGTAVSLHQPAQATNTVLAQTLVAQLPSLDNSTTEVSNSNLNQAQSSTPQLLIQSNLDQNTATQAIPQLPSLEVSSIKQKEVAKKIYTIQPGDTVTDIARQEGVSSSQIIEANQLTNPNLIRVNHQLVIPSLESIAKNNSQQAQVSNEQEFFLNNSFELAQNLTPSSFSSLTNSKAESRTKKQTLESVSANTESQINQDQDPYISKLRQDIIDLRTRYQQQNSNTQTVANVSPTSANISTAQPVSVVTPLTNSDSEDFVPEQSIASAPTPVEKFNSLLIFPKNQTVTPDLPPLSSPEEYLPDNPIFEGYMWPARGALTSGYGWRRGRMHQGIDIAAPIGTPIMAAASGEVIFSGWNSGGYGNLVKLRHPDGSITFYAHNNRLLVSNGQKVKQGQLIAEMGSTGRSTGPHLHFEIRPNGTTAINPIARLPKERLN